MNLCIVLYANTVLLSCLAPFEIWQVRELDKNNFVTNLRGLVKSKKKIEY